MCFLKLSLFGSQKCIIFVQSVGVLEVCICASALYVKPVAQRGFEIKQIKLAACLDYVYCKIFEAQLHPISYPLPHP